jgi:hypothetical protein
MRADPFVLRLSVEMSHIYYTGKKSAATGKISAGRPRENIFSETVCKKPITAGNMI